MWSNLYGLHPRTNIYITVDVPKDPDKEKLETLDQYTQALHRRFSGEEHRHVKIIVNSVNRHVNGSLRKVVFDLLDTNITKYIYVLQHDLIFMPDKIINHTAIVNAFDKYYEDEIVRIVGFSKDPNTQKIRKGGNTCQAREDLGLENPLKIYDGEGNKTDTAIYLTHSGYWTDQNHFTTVQYYRDLITRIGPKPRFPEGPMMYAAGRDCRLHGTHWYGLPDDGKYICHLDASHKYFNGICPKDFWEDD